VFIDKCVFKHLIAVCIIERIPYNGLPNQNRLVSLKRKRKQRVDDSLEEEQIPANLDLTANLDLPIDAVPAQVPKKRGKKLKATKALEMDPPPKKRSKTTKSNQEIRRSNRKKKLKF
jgi:hypothetical protein